MLFSHILRLDFFVFFLLNLLVLYIFISKKMKSIKKNLIITNISIIVFMKLLPEYKNLILKYAKECDQSKKNEKNQKQPGRPREFSNVTVLYYICMMLEHVVKWRSLYFVTKDKKKNFYSTIHKRFVAWSAYGVFEKAYQEILKENIFDQIDDETPLILYIDGTLTWNKGGTDTIGKGENKKKNNTKITIICDENKVIYDVIINSGNIHDVHTIEPLITKIREKLPENHIDLGGDKGYKAKPARVDQLKKNNVDLHVPHKRNQKEKTPEKTKIILTKRYKVEHSIQQLKIFHRVSLRKDSHIEQYTSFVFLALIKIFRTTSNKYNIPYLSEGEIQELEEKREQKRLANKEKRTKNREENLKKQNEKKEAKEKLKAEKQKIKDDKKKRS